MSKQTKCLMIFFAFCLASLCNCHLEAGYQQRPTIERDGCRPAPAACERPRISRDCSPRNNVRWNFSLGFSNYAAPCYPPVRQCYYPPAPVIVRPAPVVRYTYCNRSPMQRTLYDREFVDVVVQTPPAPCQVVTIPGPAYYESHPVDEYCPSINTVYDGGALIELNNGTLWQIAPAYLQRTRCWMACEKINVTRTKNCQYPFKLYNRSNHESVMAELKSGASDFSNQDNVEASVPLSVLSQNLSNGELLRFADNTLWEISPGGQYASRLWRSGETIKITRSNQYTYPYVLQNTMTGESVEASLKQPS